MPERLGVPAVTVEQMQEVDRLMIGEYGIALLQMMENAGRNLARLAVDVAGGVAGRTILVLVGKGNNGGGGMVAARHLSNAGSQVRVLLAGSFDQLVDVPAQQAAILRKTGIELLESKATPSELLRRAFGEADLVIDTLIGYSLAGAPRGEAAALIRLANASGRPVLSLDVPSGVDAGSGRAYEPSIRAVATMTLALPKTGLGTTEARERAGDLYLADIGVPPALYRHLGLEVQPLFVSESIIRLQWTGDGWARE